MKNHFLSRFDARNLWKTNIYFAIAVVLITISFIREYFNGNGLGILMFVIGFVLFFYAMLHPWGKVSYYFVLIVVFIILFTLLLSVGIGILTNMQLGKDLGEAIGWSFGFVCIAAVIGGIMGVSTFAKGWQRLPYIGAALSSLVIPIWLFTCILHPNLKSFILVSYWILLCVQLFIAILFFSIGYINKRESRRSKVSLIIITIVLIIMGIGLWGFMATLISDGFGKLTIRICAVSDIIIAFLALYAYLINPEPDKV
jgi:hypothetical protein